MKKEHMKIHYLDSAATAPVKYWNKDYAVFGNPNSMHVIGKDANRALKEARKRIKKALGIKSGKIIIGGTTSQLVNCLKKKINNPDYLKIRSAYEHECFTEDSSILSIPVYKIEDLEKIFIEMRKDNHNPILTAWMFVNNITGTIFPVEKIGKLCHAYNSYYIMDCTAAIGHVEIPDNIEDFCDCILASSHKFGCEIGTGFMWVSDNFAENILGLEDDSFEEYGLIPGTPNVSGAVAMSYALQHVTNSNIVKDRIELWKKLINHLIYKLDLAEIPFDFVTPMEDYTPAINAITFPGINADALATFLSSQYIYISIGHSACENDNKNTTRILESFGLTKYESMETVRISFCEDTTINDIDSFVYHLSVFKNFLEFKGKGINGK